MNLIEYEKIRFALNDEYIKTKKLIDNGETHLDNLAEGFTESDRIIRTFVTNSCKSELRPVVRGKNITEMHPVDEFICSECGIDIVDFSRYESEEDCTYEYEFKFCPNCGADMRGE